MANQLKKGFNSRRIEEFNQPNKITETNKMLLATQNIIKQ